MSNQLTVQEPPQNFNPRDYQLELYKNALKENTIVYLQTGSGKTLIAVLLIRHLAPEVAKTLAEGGRRIVFLVPTVVLAQQQADYIRRHTSLKIGEYYGELGVDLWKGERWTQEIENNNVLVMTAQLFVNAVTHGFMSISLCKLLVFDECHSAVKDAPMKQALSLVNETRQRYGEDKVPRILGLTAALFRKKCKPRDLAKIIQKLENTMKARVCTAQDMKSALNYSTKPIEIICEYASGSSENPESEWLSHHIRKLLNNTALELSINFKSLGDNNIKELTDILRDICVLTEIFGPYGTNHAVSLFANEIKRLEFQIGLDQSALRGIRLVIDVLKEIHDVCEFTFNELNKSLDRLRLFTTPHVARLLEILRDFSPNNSNTETNVVLCGLVFVDRRSSANVLYHILRSASECDPQLSYLNPLFTLGQASGNPKGKLAENHLRHNQKEIIRRFHDGSCNILVATSVLEEGVDVRACNLVVRFDGIKTYCDYVQSKGRARSPNALYILMVPNEELNDFLDVLASFHAIEQKLLNPAALRLTLDEPENPDLEEFWNTKIKPYCPYPNGPRITLLSAMGLLNWYCASLPSGGSTVLTPYWTIDEISVGKMSQSFRCKLLLPLNSPLREELVSEIMPSKRLAKREVALKACIRLHQLGELDDNHFLPLSKSLDIVEEMTEKSEDTLNKSYYPKEIARILNHGANPPYHLYLINYQVSDQSDNQSSWMDRSKYRLGFLTSDKLASVNPFGVFAPVGQVNVTFEEIASYLRLTPAEVQLCHQFQNYIFKRILELFQDKQYNQARCSYLVVPIDLASKNIDFNFINQQLESSLSDWQPPTNEYSVYRDAVVASSHNRMNGRINYYYVEAVHEKLTPRSPFPNPTFPTYFDYYKDRYNVVIKDLNQPLLEVSKESLKTLNFLTPKYLDRKQKPRQSQSFLVPELCDLHRFPASLWRQTVWLPSIFYRLNSLLLADQLRMEIQAVTGLGVPNKGSWESLPMKTRNNQPVGGSSNWKSAENSIAMEDMTLCMESSSEETRADIKDLKNFIWNIDLFNSKKEREEPVVSKEYGGRIINTRQGFLSPSIEMDDGRGAVDSQDPVLGPSPGQILQALTLAVANAGFDLERLEVMGDSFLKLATSIHIYCHSPNHFHEGKMTHLRVRQVSNSNLYQLGIKKSLPQLMTATKFLPKENWLPTCYLTNDDQKENDPQLVQLISKKAVADSVEALIGLYLTHHGINGGLKAMKWMGIDVPNSGNGNCFNDTPPSPLLIETSDAERLINDHLVGFDTLENDIDYRFGNRYYLLQAFSHASYFHNRLTSCYQRLEFLGDAVFDYLITKYLYENSVEQLTPGVLSDMRSALVNNVTFAVLAVRNGLHRFLKHMVPDMHHAIDNFVKHQELCDHVLPEEVLLIGTEDDPIATDTDVPKVLGDIFESLVGAVFLDSDMSLDTVWRVFYPLIRSEIDACIQLVPKSPIRRLYELYPGLVKFKTMENTPDGRVCMAVEIKDHERVYKGVGRNSRIAKNTAAKHALSQLNH